MAGHDAPYVPGWDCHGLPIELQVDKNLGAEEEARCRRSRSGGPAGPTPRSSSTSSARSSSAWASSASGTTPYLTMAPGYQATIVRQLAEFVEKGLVYKAKKSVHWCISCRTALAEAEVEYDEQPREPVDRRALPAAPTTSRERLAATLPGPRRQAASSPSSGPRRRGPCPRTWPSPSIPTPTTASTRSRARTTSCCSRRPCKDPRGPLDARSDWQAADALRRAARRGQGRGARGRPLPPSLDRPRLAGRARRLRDPRGRHRRRAHRARPRLGRLPDRRPLRPRHLLPGRRGAAASCPRSSASPGKKVFDANPEIVDLPAESRGAPPGRARTRTPTRSAGAARTRSSSAPPSSGSSPSTSDGRLRERALEAIAQGASGSRPGARSASTT